MTLPARADGDVHTQMRLGDDRRFTRHLAGGVGGDGVGAATMGAPPLRWRWRRRRRRVVLTHPRGQRGHASRQLGGAFRDTHHRHPIEIALPTVDEGLVPAAAAHHAADVDDRSTLIAGDVGGATARTAEHPDLSHRRLRHASVYQQNHQLRVVSATVGASALCAVRLWPEVIVDDRPGARLRWRAPGLWPGQRSALGGLIKAITVHDLGPRGDKGPHKALLAVGGGVDLRDGAQL